MEKGVTKHRIIVGNLVLSNSVTNLSRSRRKSQCNASPSLNTSPTLGNLPFLTKAADLSSSFRTLLKAAGGSHHLAMFYCIYSSVSCLFLVSDTGLAFMAVRQCFPLKYVYLRRILSK